MSQECIKANDKGNYVGFLDENKLTIFRYSHRGKFFDPNQIPQNPNSLKCADFAFIQSVTEILFAIITEDKKTLSVYKFIDEDNENYGKYELIGSCRLKKPYKAFLTFNSSPSTIYYAYQTSDSFHYFQVDQLLIGVGSVETIQIREFSDSDILSVKFASTDKIWTCKDPKKVHQIRIDYYDFNSKDPIAHLQLNNHTAEKMSIYPSPVDENLLVFAIQENDGTCTFKSLHSEYNEKNHEYQLITNEDLTCSKTDKKFQYDDVFFLWSPFGSSFAIEDYDSLQEWSLLPGYRWKSKPIIEFVEEENLEFEEEEEKEENKGKEEEDVEEEDEDI